MYGGFCWKMLGAYAFSSKEMDGVERLVIYFIDVL